MIKGELIENRIIIWNIDDSRYLFKHGFYGKPLGIPKPKNADFDVPLILDLIEGYYLVKKGVITVYRDDTKLGLRELNTKCKSEYTDFDAKYFVFSILRDNGYVVTPGIKFGCDFAVYEHGPGIDHAPYLLQVMKSRDNITATLLVLAGRLATTVRKQFILTIPKPKEKRVEFVSFDWWRA